MSVLAAIREATRDQHVALEQSMDILARLGAEDSRRDVLRRFHGAYGPAEDVLAAFLGPIGDLEFDARRKTPRLASDLRVAGLSDDEIGALPACAAPRIGCRAEAMGFAYVLEGATLGGRVIRRQLPEGTADGLSFFGIYGEHTGDRFRSFCAVLERECAASVESASAGAVEGFRYMAAALLDHGTR